VPELGSLGSVRGALSNERPYRDVRQEKLARSSRETRPECASGSNSKAIDNRWSPLHPIIDYHFGDSFRSQSWTLVGVSNPLIIPPITPARSRDSPIYVHRLAGAGIIRLPE